MDERSRSLRGRWKWALMLQAMALAAVVGLAGATQAAHDNGKGRGLACGHASRQVSPPASPEAGRPTCPPQAGPKK